MNSITSSEQRAAASRSRMQQCSVRTSTRVRGKPSRAAGGREKSGAADELAIRSLEIQILNEVSLFVRGILLTILTCERQFF